MDGSPATGASGCREPPRPPRRPSAGRASGQGRESAAGRRRRGPRRRWRTGAGGTRIWTSAGVPPWRPAAARVLRLGGTRVQYYALAGRRGHAGREAVQRGLRNAISIPPVTSATPANVAAVGTSASRKNAATTVMTGTVAVKTDTSLAPSRATARV